MFGDIITTCFLDLVSSRGLWSRNLVLRLLTLQTHMYE